MNVPFKLRDEQLDAAFLKGAEARGMVQLKGHRSVGGMRASIYNAMPIAGVQALVGLDAGIRAAQWLTLKMSALGILLLNPIAPAGLARCRPNGTGSART
jgi:hypothetical protein